MVLDLVFRVFLQRKPGEGKQKLFPLDLLGLRRGELGCWQQETLWNGRAVGTSVQIVGV